MSEEQSSSPKPPRRTRAKGESTKSKGASEPQEPESGAAAAVAEPEVAEMPVKRRLMLLRGLGNRRHHDIAAIAGVA